MTGAGLDRVEAHERADAGWRGQACQADRIDFDVPHHAVLLRPVGEKVSLPVLRRGARQAMPRARRDPSNHAALAQQSGDQATDGFGRVALLQQSEAATRPVLGLMQVGGDLPERRNGGLVPR